MNTTFLVLAALAVLVFVVMRSRSSKSNIEQNDHEGDGEFTGRPDEISSIHPGMEDVGGSKFDANEVGATAFLPKPHIDMDNIPAPDPRVAQVLADVDAEDVLQQLKELSGEVPTKVGGRTVTLKTRNSFTGASGIGLSMEYLEQIFAAHGIATRRVPYKVWGRTYFNLEATIPGRLDPNRVLVLGSHMDATAGRPRRKEVETPGAEDNGSGTIGTLQMALGLAKLELDYTVRVVLFTGEEQGLFGSYAYSDQLADEVKNDGIEVIAMLNHDMIGYTGTDTKRYDVHDEKDRNGSRELLVKFFRNVKRYGIDLAPFDTHNYAVRNRSDHAGFLDNGFKAIMFSEEFTPANFYPYYHSLQDRVDKLSMPYLVAAIRGGIALAAELASKE